MLIRRLDTAAQNGNDSDGLNEEMERVMGGTSPPREAATYGDGGEGLGTGGNSVQVPLGMNPWMATRDGVNTDIAADGRDFGDGLPAASRPNRYVNPLAAAGPSNGNAPGQQRRPRREKFMPEERGDDELYNDQIEAGDGFSEFLVNNINVTCIQNGHTRVEIPLVDSFKECGFSTQLTTNLDLYEYETPSAVQSIVLPAMLMSTSDLVVSADTGSGKSASWLLPIIHDIQHLMSQGSPGSMGKCPYAIILLPTKELTEHLYNYTRGLLVNTGVKAARSYGDMPMRESIASIRTGCDLFFGTCGRAKHLILTESDLLQLDQVRWLIFDEADKMVSNDEFFNACEEINECLKNRRGEAKYRQLMFSATYENMFRVEKFLRPDFIVIEVGERNRAAPTVEQNFIKVLKYDKPTKLVEILRAGSRMVQEDNGVVVERRRRTIVFVNTKRMCERIAIMLAQKGIRVITLNSDRCLEQRLTAVRSFSQNVFDVLIATDVASRGLNFPHVDLVVNYELPPVDAESYIHRIGRTGRAGNVGNSITFFDPNCTTDLRMAEFLVKTLTSCGDGGHGLNQVPVFLQDIVNSEERERVDLIYHTQLMQQAMQNNE